MESVNLDEAKERTDWGAVAQSVVRSRAFWPGVAVAVTLTVLFWMLFKRLPVLWGNNDYYSHGFLVPFISGYIIYRWWPSLSKIEVKTGLGSVVGFLLILMTLPMIYAARQLEQMQLLSLGFLVISLLGIWFVAGWRWMLALAPPILYLAFALELWSGPIDVYTNPLQILSTKVAYSLLQASGFDVYRSNQTTIYLNNFVLNVEVPCSGLKLMLAVTAFTFFFVMIDGMKTWPDVFAKQDHKRSVSEILYTMIGRERWYSNVIMILLIIPLCLLINGLRIALIGVVGETQGAAAGIKFHDYSGYITLLVCFFLLFKFARWLGWKD